MHTYKDVTALLYALKLSCVLLNVLETDTDGKFKIYQKKKYIIDLK